MCPAPGACSSGLPDPRAWRIADREHAQTNAPRPLPPCPRSRAAAAFRPAAAAAGRRAAALRVVAQAAAPATAAAPAATKRSQYELQTLTTWLLDLEKKGTIDNELAAVISSIATACKQIGSLVNRAGISNLTGLAGETNVQVGGGRGASGRPACPLLPPSPPRPPGAAASVRRAAPLRAPRTPPAAGRGPEEAGPAWRPALHRPRSVCLHPCPQGEDQKKLDVISNEVFSNCLRTSGRTGVIASEEEDQPVRAGGARLGLSRGAALRGRAEGLLPGAAAGTVGAAALGGERTGKLPAHGQWWQTPAALLPPCRPGCFHTCTPCTARRAGGRGGDVQRRVRGGV